MRYSVSSTFTTSCSSISNESFFNLCTVHCSRNKLLKEKKKKLKSKEKNQAELSELMQIVLI